jgi:hypothetical protein
MTADESAGDALFRKPLPAGFSKHVLRVAPGLELGSEATCLPDAIIVVEQGALEVECRSGVRRRFARGSILAVAGLPGSRLRSVGSEPLVLMAVARATDEFLRGAGSYCDC